MKLTKRTWVRLEYGQAENVKSVIRYLEYLGYKMKAKSSFEQTMSKQKNVIQMYKESEFKEKRILKKLQHEMERK